MQLTLSSKGQIVLPAPIRRRLRLKARSKLEVEERDGGVFIRLASRTKAIEPIEYLPPGAIRQGQRDYDLQALAGPDEGPDES
ncbi:MAG: AbrB/MazE/SpoVT family DNA-binding domain-containing protein [Opitutaceae bacterium]|nr:AbrB/MazE/SpoVT family DNA-binding domain-containing protein [Opitutaceae bacterium]